MSPRMDGTTETITVKVPAEVADELDKLDSDRVEEVVVDALREALDLVESAEARRDSLRQKMGITSKETEELADDDDSNLSAEQRKLIENIKEGGRR